MGEAELEELLDGAASLAMEELRRLPDGSEVMVTWSGGNGPHRYVLRWHYGTPWAFIDEAAVGAIRPGSGVAHDKVVLPLRR